MNKNIGIINKVMFLNESMILFCYVKHGVDLSGLTDEKSSLSLYQKMSAEGSSVHKRVVAQYDKFIGKM